MALPPLQGHSRIPRHRQRLGIARRLSQASVRVPYQILQAMTGLIWRKKRTMRCGEEKGNLSMAIVSPCRRLRFRSLSSPQRVVEGGWLQAQRGQAIEPAGQCGDGAWAAMHQ